MVPIRAAYNIGGNQATLGAKNGRFLCASGIARVTVLLGPANAPANGPLGTQHLVLLEERAGKWVIANDTLCKGGQPATKTSPVSAAAPPPTIMK